MIAVTGIQTDWRDVSYFIRKKSGFPAITDMGLVDVFMGGEGFSFKFVGSTSQKKLHFVKPDKVSISVKNLNINIKKSRHKVLFVIFRPLIFRALRSAVEELLEKKIRDSIIEIDKLAYDIHAEAQHAQEVARGDSENKESAYTFYVDAVRKQLVERKEKAASKQKRVTTINFAFTDADAILKDIKLPEGISKKATEFKDLAAQGDKWESPVFEIGSASPSMDLPSLAPITRKRHGITAEAGGSKEVDQA